MKVKIVCERDNETKEVEAANIAGINAEFVEETNLPFKKDALS